MRKLNMFCQVLVVGSIHVTMSLLLDSSAALAQSDARVVNYDEIPERVQIIGKLGRPFGELATIRGTWVVKAESEKPQLPVFLVREIDGKPTPRRTEIDRFAPAWGGVEKLNRTADEDWELRGVEMGGFEGFSSKVYDEIRSLNPKLPPSVPRQGGFLTTFYYLTAKRISTEKAK